MKSTDAASFAPTAAARKERPNYKIVALEGIDGAGKTSVVKAVEQALDPRLRVHTARLSTGMGGIFREMIDRTREGRQRYQDVIPPAFRHATYIVDAAVQFRYLAPQYEQYDVLLFDRWLPTYDIYCSDIAETPYDEWYRWLSEWIPAPDLLFYLTIDPREAASRVATRGDWTATHWTSSELLTDLTRLDEKYRRAMAERPHHLVDANRPLPQVVDTVLDQISQLVARPGMRVR